MMWCIPLNIQSASRTRKFKSKFASGASNRQKHNFYDLDDFGVRISFWCNLHTSRRVNEQTYCIHSDWTIVVLLLQIPPMLSHDSQGTGRWCRGWVDLLATRRSRSQKAAFLTAKNGGTIPTTLRLLEEMFNMPLAYKNISDFELFLNQSSHAATLPLHISAPTHWHIDGKVRCQISCTWPTASMSTRSSVYQVKCFSKFNS